MRTDRERCISVFIGHIRIFLVLSFLSSAYTFGIAAQKHTFEAEAAVLIGRTSKVAESAASEGYVVRLTEPGDGIKFTGLPAGEKLAVRYASSGVGSICVAVNNRPVQKLNVHSSGDLTSSFLFAIVEIAIPADAMLSISVVTDNITVNIDQIVVGDHDLGLPPDI